MRKYRKMQNDIQYNDENENEYIKRICCSDANHCNPCDKYEFLLHTEVVENTYKLFLSKDAAPMIDQISSRTLCCYYGPVDEKKTEQLEQLRFIDNLPDDLWLYEKTSGTRLQIIYPRYDTFFYVNGEEWLIRQWSKKATGTITNLNIDEADICFHKMEICKVFRFIGSIFYTIVNYDTVGMKIGEFTKEDFERAFDLRKERMKNEFN